MHAKVCRCWSHRWSHLCHFLCLFPCNAQQGRSTRNELRKATKHLQNGVGGQGKRRACPTRISVLFWTRPLGDTIALGQFVRLRGLLRALECGTKVVSFAIQHDPCGELAGGGLAHALREVVPATRRTRGSARRVAQSREHPAPTHGNGPGWIGVDKLRSAVAIGNNCRNSRLSTPLSTRTAPSGELTRGGVPLRAKLTGRPRRNRAVGAIERGRWHRGRHRIDREAHRNREH